jgi:hypothetical protein
VTDTKLTLGQAIDAIVGVLEKLDAKSRDTALTAACAHLGISSVAPPNTVAEQQNQASHSSLDSMASVSRGIVDIRTLKTQKQPKSAQQMACLVAYYLQEVAPSSDRKATITADDIEKYFKQAGYKLPTKIRQVLSDGKLLGYFDPVARGEYKLNAVGYNLVAHSMPSKQE